jgi:hypothetical protein
MSAQYGAVGRVSARLPRPLMSGSKAPSAGAEHGRRSAEAQSRSAPAACRTPPAPPPPTPTLTPGTTSQPSPPPSRRGAENRLLKVRSAGVLPQADDEGYGGTAGLLAEQEPGLRLPISIESRMFFCGTAPLSFGANLRLGDLRRLSTDHGIPAHTARTWLAPPCLTVAKRQWLFPDSFSAPAGFRHRPGSKRTAEERSHETANAHVPA